MITLYGYTKCSTCRDAKKWLEAKGHEVQFIDLVQEPPAAELLQEWMEKSDLPIRRFFNTSGQLYRAEGLKDLIDGYTIEEASQKLNSNGMLIKRPILVRDNHFLANGFKEEVYEGVL